MASELDKTTLLKERENRIGGSDIAAILGISPWSTPVSVYLRLCGMATPTEETEAMRRGTILEDPVARVYAARKGYKVYDQRKSILDGYRVAHIDRVVDIGDGVTFDENDNIVSTKLLECKTSRDGWDNGVPMYYIVQGDWYMINAPTVQSVDFACKSNVFGYSQDTIEMLAAVQAQMNAIAAMAAKSQEDLDLASRKLYEQASGFYIEFLSRFGDKDFDIYTIERDDNRNAAIIARVEDFYNAHVLMAKRTGDVMTYAPPPMNEDDCKLLWSRHTPNKTVTFDTLGLDRFENGYKRQVLEAVVRHTKSKKDIVDAKDKADKCEFIIKRVMKDAEYLCDGEKDSLITYRTSSDKEEVDWESLAKSLKPSKELIKKFTYKKSGSRRFTPSKKIEDKILAIETALEETRSDFNQDCKDRGISPDFDFIEAKQNEYPNAEAATMRGAEDGADAAIDDTPFGPVEGEKPRVIGMTIDDGKVIPMTVGGEHVIPMTVEPVVAPMKSELERANELF